MAIGTFPVHYLRLTVSLVATVTFAFSVFTSAYWMAGAYGVILVILLLIPFSKDRLYE
jgi:hypothetical protein